jgi:hypothetical protein
MPVLFGNTDWTKTFAISSLDYNSLVTSELIESLVQEVPLLQSFSIAFAGSDTSIDEKALLKVGDWRGLTEVGLAISCNNCHND